MSTLFTNQDSVVVKGSSPPLKTEYQYQSHLSWAELFKLKMAEKVPQRPYLAVHIRVASDMAKSCARIKDNPGIFAFKQCADENIPPIEENCVPSANTILNNIYQNLKSFDHIRAVYLATDSYYFVQKQIYAILREKYSNFKIYLNPASTEFGDLYLMEQADVFLGSCVSTYSAFVVRSRRLNNKVVKFIHVSNETEASNGIAKENNRSDL